MIEPTSETSSPPDASAASKDEPSHADSGGLRPPLREKSEPEFGGASRLKSLDADVETELAEAMKGFSEQELYAGAPSAPETTPGKSGPEEKQKKGRVLAIRGGDVFVDVPGGRSQGVLSASQFPQGPPAVGSEVAFHIEGYDAENGLLILALQGAAQTADWSSVT